jgi:hypothetical protein
MAKYLMVATGTDFYSLEVEADNEDEAWEIAQDTDVSDWKAGDSEFEIESAEKLTTKGKKK